MSARPIVHGLNLDAETRCAHWASSLDIVAIKMRCCGVYYACKDCHAAMAGHPITLWPRASWNESAILCGACGAELSINAYMRSGDRCPACTAPFNPGCRTHYHFYFEESVA
ncbi:MAG TPA: CHY zinc finger protein [Caulobacteraceae bacterium]|nr:CHY zinc finger protein [Caulobacteraceae bacterium]